MGRSHRVAVDTFGFDLIAAPPFNLIVEAQDQFASRGEGRNQQSQQDSAGFQGRPSRTVQDPMVVGEASFLAQPHDTQAGVTVRLPGAKIAPPNKTLACYQTGWRTKVISELALCQTREL